MNFSYLKSAEYWTEEFNIPLYLITDKRQIAFKNNFLCVYQKNTSTFYFLNQRDKQEARIGYTYFSKKENVKLYEQDVANILRKLRQITNDNNFEMKKILSFLYEWNNIYFKTEATRLKKFEETNRKVSFNIEKIGRLRLEMRKKLESILFPQFDKALENIAQKNGIKVDDLFFYTHDELLFLLERNKKVRKDLIFKRKNGYVFLIFKGQKKFCTSKEFKGLSDYLYSVNNSQNIHEVRGQIAFKGLVKGRARIILHNEEDLNSQLKKFQKGEILVTEMTRPQTLLICKKTIGIITDEGGIICHAAIIARELKIPCIVGTKNATKILKNGDMIELDANKGVVKIL